MLSENFYRQNNKGKVAEKIVKRHLENRGHIIKDVSGVKEYQNIDVDFLVTNQEGQQTKLEIKRDDGSDRSGNLYFELNAYTENGQLFRKGWVNKCQANYICFYNCQSGRGYIVDWQKIKPILFTLGYEKNHYNKIDDCYNSAVLVPIKTLREQNLIIYEWSD